MLDAPRANIDHDLKGGSGVWSFGVGARILGITLHPRSNFLQTTL